MKVLLHPWIQLLVPNSSMVSQSVRFVFYDHQNKESLVVSLSFFPPLSLFNAANSLPPTVVWAGEEMIFKILKLTMTH